VKLDNTTKNLSSRDLSRLKRLLTTGYGGDQVSLEDIERIERSSPFVRRGKFITHKQGSHEDPFRHMTLADFDYIKSDGNNSKVLGKGSYGEVELARIVCYRNP
jgi:hypothetical protein